MKKTMFLSVILAMILPAYIGHARYAVGDHIADFTLLDAQGNSVNLYDYNGLVVFLNFWEST